MENIVVIKEVIAADESLFIRIKELLAQLSSSPVEFTMAGFEEMVASPASHLFVALCDGNVSGMLTLGEYLAPTGRKMWIEDVVVDEAARGRSLGRKLVEHAIGCAEQLGAGTLMLTSRPSRVAANALYRSCGFVIKETNRYRMKIESE